MQIIIRLNTVLIINIVQLKRRSDQFLHHQDDVRKKEDVLSPPVVFKELLLLDTN